MPNYPVPGQQTGLSGFVHNNLGRLALTSGNPYILGAYGGYRLGSSLYNAIANHYDPSRNTQESWQSNAASNSGGSSPGYVPSSNTGGSSDPNNPLNQGSGGTSGPYYPPTTTTGSNLAPPVTNNPTAQQHATNMENNFQTGFQNLQSMSYDRNRNQDEVGFDGRMGFNASQGNPNNAALQAYQSMYPMGTHIPDQQAFSQNVLSGATPSWQQFTGKPAYIPGSTTAPTGQYQDFIPRNATGPYATPSGPQAGVSTTSGAPDYQSQIASWIKQQYPQFGG